MSASLSKPAALVLALVLAAISWLSVAAMGCGMSTAERINLVHVGALQLKDVAAKPWSDACEVKARKCVADGVQESKDCKPWVDCQAGLKKLYQAHHLVQVSVEKAAWWLLKGDESTAQKVLGVAMTALAEAWTLAKSEGLVK